MRTITFKTAGTLIAIIISLAILFTAGRSLLKLDQRSRESGVQMTREAIDRAVMQCYALEGAYPPHLKYLRDNYGLVADADRYNIYYDPVAGNIRPIIDVRLPEDQYDE